MTEFLRKEVGKDKFELLIDAKLFPKEVILKSAYNFLDKGYFFFRSDGNDDIILQFSQKDGVTETPEQIIGDFSDEMLNVYLRDSLEKQNKEIRETIVNKALSSSLDSSNHVSIDTDKKANVQIDFDKDIDEILKEIENDPDLKIDEEEIERILKEIEAESANSKIEQKFVLDPKNAKDAKKRFSDGE